MNLKKFGMTWVKTAIMLTLVTSIFSITGLAQSRRYRYQYRDHSINERQREQEARIREGIRSGELTRHEAGRLEAQEARIRRDEARARLSGGEFTPRERARIQRELDREGHRIYREKHDRQDRYR